MKKVNGEIETIRPPAAREMLMGSNGNRKLSSRVVEKYRRDMESGNWVLNGEPIIIAQDGSLLDGQHRLQACAESGKPLKTFVVRGVDKSVFFSIDAGKGRSVADALHAKGETNVNVLASACLLLLIYAKGGTDRSATSPTNAEKLAFLEANPLIREAASFASNNRGPLPTSFCAALWYLGGQVDAARTVQFLTRVQTGENISSGMPEYALRTALLPRYGRAHGATIERWVIFAIAIKALNASLSGRRVSFLRWNRGDPFPAFEGPTPPLAAG